MSHSPLWKWFGHIHKYTGEAEFTITLVLSTHDRLNAVVNSLNSTVSTDCLKRVEKLKLDLDLFRDTEATGFLKTAQRGVFPAVPLGGPPSYYTRNVFISLYAANSGDCERGLWGVFGTSASINTQQSARCFLFISANIFLKNDFKAILTKYVYLLLIQITMCKFSVGTHDNKPMNLSPNCSFLARQSFLLSFAIFREGKLDELMTWVWTVC